MTTMAEPEWDEQTRALVMGEVDYQSKLCPLCGRPTSVCQNPENQDRFSALDPVRCHATTALLAKQATYNEQTNPHLRALLWGTRLIDEEEFGG